MHELSWNKEKKLIQGKVRQRDFQKTNTTPEYLSQVFEEIKIAFPEMETTLLLWYIPATGEPSNEKVEGVIYSLNPELLKSLAPGLNGTLKNGSLSFSAPLGSASTQRGEQDLALGKETEDNILAKVEKRVSDLIDKEL